ncbi:MAG: type II toxin-antitoxin system RelE/ParE family toxin [Methylococcales bacterium]
MKRVFKTRTFNRWMRKSDLRDQDLCRAVSEMEQGLIDTHLGGHVVKKRVALAGRGKRGSARTLVATNLEGRWFFLFGFEKNERANIDDDELRVLQETARDLLRFNHSEIAAAVFKGELLEICHDYQDA